METNILIISSYPAKGSIHGHGTVGIASYTKNTLLALKKYLNKEKIRSTFIVIAEKINPPGRSPFGHLPGDTIRKDGEVYSEGGITVKRVWKRNDPFTFLYLLQEAISYPTIKTVVIEFEMAMFGSFGYLLLLPIFLLFLKLFGKRIFFVSHQALSDINEISGHIGLTTSSIQSDVINIAIKLFYSLTFVLCSKIIVFESYLKEILSQFVNSRKIAVIPHGIEEYLHKPDYLASRKKLAIADDEFVILYFGFIAWYKGADWIVNRISEISNQLSVKMKKRIKLVIAGGGNPNHMDKKFYRDYVEEIKKVALSSRPKWRDLPLSDSRKIPRLRFASLGMTNMNSPIIVTDFVQEKDIPYYFAAADVVVFPYRTLMSSSGPFSIALEFNKPFLLSAAASRILDSSDLKDALDESGLDAHQISFELLGDSFDKKLQRMAKDKKLQEKLHYFCRLVKKERSFEIIAGIYYRLLDKITIL